MDTDRYRLLTIGVLGVLASPVAGSWVSADGPTLEWKTWSSADGGNDHRYAIWPEPGYWERAFLEAKKHGAHLATLTSPEEEAWVRETFSSTEGYWLGFTRSRTYRAVERRWKWITDEPVDYTNWAPGHPDDAYPPQDFAMMNWGGESGWDDHARAGPAAAYPYGAVFEIGTAPRSGPPFLFWSGEPGFVDDGVDPDTGGAGETLFTFRVRIADPDNDRPDFVRLTIYKDNTRYITEDMRAVRRSATTGFGRAYTYRLRRPLPPGSYTYCFWGTDDDGLAYGPPTESQSLSLVPSGA
ncbi:MAG TPA: lectin-like protein [Armatimonadota bacterium]|nr:lectin-like protein [Armatimonadota bacterium]